MNTATGDDPEASSAQVQDETDTVRDWISPHLGPRLPYLQFYAVSDEARLAAHAFEPRASDVTIATYTKSYTEGYLSH